MTDISLPDDQVSNIIEETAEKVACGQGKKPENITQRIFVSILTEFGHMLLHVLGEAQKGE